MLRYRLGQCLIRAVKVWIRSVIRAVKVWVRSVLRAVKVWIRSVFDEGCKGLG